MMFFPVLAKISMDMTDVTKTQKIELRKHDRKTANTVGDA